MSRHSYREWELTQSRSRSRQCMMAPKFVNILHHKLEPRQRCSCWGVAQVFPYSNTQQEGGGDSDGCQLENTSINTFDMTWMQLTWAMALSNPPPPSKLACIPLEGKGYVVQVSCGRRQGDGYDDSESNSQSERVSVDEGPATLFVWSHVHLRQGAST